MDGYSVRQLSYISKRSEKKIRLIVNYWLNLNLDDNLQNFSHIKYLVFDGSYIWRRKISAIILLDAETGKLVVGKYDFKESRVLDLIKLFLELRTHGLEPKSVTIDGNPAVIRAFQMVWPNIIIQRCLVHVQRQGLQWCRVNPKTVTAKKLRKMFVGLTRIETVSQREYFLEEVQKWELRYGSKIKSKPEHGWVFSDLKRARSMLLKALPNMFHYILNQRIPKTTNMAEGYFSFMKFRYRDHRGLSPKKRKSFFNWFFFFRP